MTPLVVTGRAACLDEQTLADLVSGELATGALRRVEAHLVDCAECRSMVADAVHGALGPALAPTRGGDRAWPQVGEVVADKYRIEAPLGRGGMGVVFAATHIELGQRVAIKVLDSGDSLASARFLREAKTCARLVNDHIVRVFDLGRLPGGVPYFVMEHLRGRDLGSLISRERLPLPLAVQYLLQVCAALKEAHARGVIHRDLKPSNLFVVERSDGQPWIKVLDFGISKLLAPRLGETPPSTLTSPGAVLGSPLYMSPEQIRGSKALDARSDLWSLGVIAYELLTGQRPFRAPTLAGALVAIATEQPARPSVLVPQLPARLEGIVLRCLQKDPAARFPNVEALIDALSPFARQEQRSASVTSNAAAPPARAPLPRWPLLLAATALLAPSPWLFWRTPPQPIPHTVPVVTAALAPPRVQVSVRCDRPLPAGSIRLGVAGVWPVERLCEAETSDARRSELAAALADAHLEGARLEPEHPSYSLVLARTPAQLTLELRHVPRASSATVSAPRARPAAPLRARAPRPAKPVLIRDCLPPAEFCRK